MSSSKEPPKKLDSKATAVSDDPSPALPDSHRPFGINSRYILDAHLEDSRLLESVPRPGPTFPYMANYFRDCTEAEKRDQELYVNHIHKELPNQFFWSCIPKKYHPKVPFFPDLLDCHPEFLYQVLLCIKLTKVQAMINDDVLHASLDVVVVPQRPSRIYPGGKSGIVYLGYQLGKFAREQRERMFEAYDRLERGNDERSAN